jgi:hypothetical protein
MADEGLLCVRASPAAAAPCFRWAGNAETLTLYRPLTTVLRCHLQIVWKLPTVTASAVRSSESILESSCLEPAQNTSLIHMGQTAHQRVMRGRTDWHSNPLAFYIFQRRDAGTCFGDQAFGSAKTLGDHEQLIVNALASPNGQWRRAEFCDLHVTACHGRDNFGARAKLAPFNGPTGCCVELAFGACDLHWCRAAEMANNDIFGQSRRGGQRQSGGADP